MSAIKSKTTTSWWDWAPNPSGIKRRKASGGELKKNYIPPVLAILIYAVSVWYFFPVKDFVAVWISKFVELLQITKVLKLSFLTDKRLYEYSSLAIVCYISFAFFLDLLRFLRTSLFHNLKWEGEKLVLSKWSWSGKETVRWNPNQPGIQILHKNGFFRRILGFERLVFFTNLSDAGTSIVAESPFFFSKSNVSFLNPLFDSE
ncbi:LIC20162 family protein [Leptospira wolffii]|uniref:LIC20162 family protein n=1 Tax=Leptospira wolffii TaxID=409998 RepID=UPI000311D74F|nr:hypothetical protein [Leptospira wolffii]EPG66125.1 hypothetical protein LEP1GSC061_2338 [Leptospira wolffii serovar Khorat str. Khorat-H2]